jgi:hypothetical protein
MRFTGWNKKYIEKNILELKAESLNSCGRKNLNKKNNEKELPQFIFSKYRVNHLVHLFLNFIPRIRDTKKVMDN